MATQVGPDVLIEQGAILLETVEHKAQTLIPPVVRDDLIGFTLDINSAEVLLTADRGPAEAPLDPRVANVVDRIDGDLLDAIAQVWHRGKGRPDPFEAVVNAPRILMPILRRGSMVAWEEVFPKARRDIYAFDRKYFEVIESYCPVSGCTCGEVVVHFEPVGHDPMKEPGQVFLQLSSGATRFEPRRKSGLDLLERLWAAYGHRYRDYLARLRRRDQVIKDLASRAVSTAARPAVATKVGRNERCPCGSGKKYKLCCGAD